MALKDYLAECVMYERNRAEKDFMRRHPDGRPPIMDKRIWTPRDDYGKKTSGR
jgi:hypothetical protein